MRFNSNRIRQIGFHGVLFRFRNDELDGLWFWHNTNVVNSKMIRVRSWIDSQGIGIPDWWQLKYFGSVGIDPYSNPEGDGWNNLQKFQNNMDPFSSYPPPNPNLT